MAGKKISELPTGTQVSGPELFPAVQSATTKKFALSSVLAWIKSQISASSIGAQPTITASGILKGDGAGGVSAATAGTDYQAPLTAGTDYATPRMIPTVPSAYTSNPEMDGTASPGSSGAWAKGDHVHPSDTSKTDLTLITQYQESSSTSSRNYKVGEFFVYNGLICRVVSPISAGQAITPGSNIAYNTAMPMFESVTDTTTAGGILALSTVLRGRVILAVTAPGYIAIPWQAATGYWYLNILNPGNMNLVASTSVTASIWYY